MKKAKESLKIEAYLNNSQNMANKRRISPKIASKSKEIFKRIQ